MTTKLTIYMQIAEELLNHSARCVALAKKLRKEAQLTCPHDACEFRKTEEGYHTICTNCGAALNYTGTRIIA